MKRPLLLTGLLVVGAGFLFWWFSTPQVIKRRTISMLETAAVPSGMSDIGRSSRGPNLATYLDEQVRFSPPGPLSADIPNSLNRDQVAALYSAAANYCTRIEFGAPRFESIKIDDDQAQVHFRVDAVADFPGVRPSDGEQVVDLIWHKVGGDWLLSEMAWVETARP